MFDWMNKGRRNKNEQYTQYNYWPFHVDLGFKFYFSH